MTQAICNTIKVRVDGKLELAEVDEGVARLELDSTLEKIACRHLILARLAGDREQAVMGVDLYETSHEVSDLVPIIAHAVYLGTPLMLANYAYSDSYLSQLARLKTYGVEVDVMLSLWLSILWYMARRGKLAKSIVMALYDSGRITGMMVYTRPSQPEHTPILFSTSVFSAVQALRELAHTAEKIELQLDTARAIIVGLPQELVAILNTSPVILAAN